MISVYKMPDLDMFCPVVVCDVCGRRILDAGMGAALFSASGGAGSLSPVKHVHKACFTDDSPWEELKTHLEQLHLNMVVDPLG